MIKHVVAQSMGNTCHLGQKLKYLYEGHEAKDSERFQGGNMAQQDQSPITGILEEDKVFVDFGEHEGKSILEIADTEPEFYSFLIEKKELGHCTIRRSRDKYFRLYVKQTAA